MLTYSNGLGVLPCLTMDGKIILEAKDKVIISAVLKKIVCVQLFLTFLLLIT